jgi:hypothetical protein
MLIAVGMVLAASLLAWLNLTRPTPAEAPAGVVAASKTEITQVTISPQARANLGLKIEPVTLQTFRRSIPIPGVIVDRPGRTDRGISAPVTGVITAIHAFPGDTVKAGERLFSLKLTSESLQNAQADLFRNTKELILQEKIVKRLEATRDTVPESQIVEAKAMLGKLQGLIRSSRLIIQSGGLSQEQIAGILEGKFVAQLDIFAPSEAVASLIEGKEPSKPTTAPSPSNATKNDLAYEVQELKVELGQQVQAGHLLAMLANHRELYIEGHGFRREAPLVERATRNAWPVEVEFSDSEEWSPTQQIFVIRHLANMADPTGKTFAFFLPLLNESRTYQRDGKTHLIWRYRPGQRVRLHVPVEEWQKVIVLPADAIVHDGPEVYAFRENGDNFDRRSVHLLYEDRRHAVLKFDGSLTPGVGVAQGGAASLLRILKAQAAALSGSGVPPGFHMHPDGSIHANH